MWTDTTSALHARTGLALPRYMTNVEWALIEPLLADAAAVLPAGIDDAVRVLPGARQSPVAGDQPHPADGDARSVT